MERKLLLNVNICCLLLCGLFLGHGLMAQGKKKKRKNNPASTVETKIVPDASLLKGMTWRSIGPYRGGDPVR